MKKYFLLLVCFTCLAGPKPKSIHVDASSTSVPTAFSSSASGSLVLQNLTKPGGPYKHLSIQNDTKSPISWLTLAEVSATPAATVTGNRLFVVSSGAHSWDDVSVLDNLYIQSEDNGIVEGDIWINVW